MASHISITTPVALAFVLFSSVASGFDRKACRNTTRELLQNQSLSLQSELFYRNPLNNQIYNGYDNFTLTLHGCNTLCGPEQSWYLDIGPRLVVWLIPIFLVVFSMDLNPLDRRRFVTIIHLLGDPIDSIWSLIHKLDATDRCYSLVLHHKAKACYRCQRVMATILAGFEEVQGPEVTSENELVALITSPKFKRYLTAWHEAALRLSDGRNDQWYRTIFAVFLFVFSLIAAFVPVVGGEQPGPPGGRIATVALLSWLVPAVLTSNIIGTLTSTRTAYDIMADLREMTAEEVQCHPAYRITEQIHDRQKFRAVSEGYFCSLAWNGGIYTYRPWKLYYITRTKNRHLRTLSMILLASLPIVIGFVGGVLILWYQLVIGPNCRHLWLFTVTILWASSAFTTSATWLFGLRGRRHWRFTIIKDACVAIPCLVVMILSACGLFNFCWCWSGLIVFSGQRHVPLVETVYEIDARTIYPMIIGVVLALQLAVVIAIATIWRRGRQVLRWSEQSRREQRAFIIGNSVCVFCL